MIGKYDSMDVIMSQGKELIDFYRNNPCIAVYDLLRVDLDAIQRRVFEDMWFKNYAIIVMGRGGGKTFMLGTLACLSCLLIPGYRVGLIGPVFRQSKMIFSEVEKLYSKSPILREACEKKPIRGTDTCYLKFKSVGGYNGSFIEGLPLGDGSKIRGSRFYLIAVDELAQVPDKVLDMVVRPMGATTLEPMENVRRLQRKKKLIDAGLATEGDFEEETVNKMIMTSSGYFKFNHMWRRMKDYWRQIEEAELEGKDCEYAVWQVPHWDLSEGFLDKKNIEEGKRTMSDAEYRMEYEAAMISDSEGFFKASLLEACTIDSGFSLELRGRPNASYILGVDPNQGGAASCGMVIIKIGKKNQIVNVLELKRKTTQELTKAVQDVCKNYNIVRIFMDKGGGGKAVMDLLEEGYNKEEPIIDRLDDDKRHLKGRHTLEMVNFNTAWIADANFATKAMLEDKRLLFPEPPTSTSDLEAKLYENITTLKSQMLNIVVTQTAGGALHFDTPKKGQNKDLYSAIILAGYGARLMERELEGPPDQEVYSEGGMVRARKAGSDWGVTQKNLAKPKMDRGLQSALLKKPIK